VIAGTDCGFSTVAGYTMVAEDVVWAKLRTLADGAAIATRRLRRTTPRAVGRRAPVKVGRSKRRGPVKSPARKAAPPKRAKP
jgi:hypothetical protein